MWKRTARLEVHELGDRILPSVTVLTAPAKSAKVIVGPQAPLSSLSGSGQGSYVPAPTRFGASPQFTLRGTGTITGMGSVTVTGTLQAPALKAQGPVTGLMTLTTAHGSITVSLTAPSQSGTAPLPTSFQYKIVGSSGQFFGSTAQGTMHLSLTRGSHNQAVMSFSF